MLLQPHDKLFGAQWNTPLLIGDYTINNSQSQMSWLDDVMIDGRRWCAMIFIMSQQPPQNIIILFHFIENVPAISITRDN